MDTPTLSLTLHLFGEPGLGEREREDVWGRCHEPALEALERDRSVRVGLVIGGDLVPHWEEQHPQRLDRIRTLLLRGQVELVATPLFEPVLSAVPERDGTDQLLAHVTLLKRVFEVRPSGCWLPFRMWDPALPRTLERADLRWCFVDDAAIAQYHPGRPDPWGCWRTERGGHAVTLLAADSRAVEMAADVPVPDLLVYARGRAAQGASTQFWAWPTARFGLRRGRSPEVDSRWLVGLLDGLQASEGLELLPPSEALAGSVLRGRTYLPSYAPPDRALPWERHLVDAPEADRLHKKMLRVSRRVARLVREAEDARPDPDQLVQAQRYLHRAQAEDAYRPGDDPVRRARAWRDLVRSERAVLTAHGSNDRLLAEVVDLEALGRRQALLRTPSLCAVVDPELSGGLTELSAYAAARNLVDTWTRTPDGGHDGADHRLRVGFVEHALAPDQDLAALHLDSPRGHARWTLLSTEKRGDRGVRATLSRTAELPGADGPQAVEITKVYTVRNDPRLELSLELANRGIAAVRTRFAVEVTLTPHPDLSVVAVHHAGEARPASEPFALSDVDVVRLEGPECTLRVRFRRPCRLTGIPVRTRRLSGAVVDQGLCLYAEWPVQLLPRERDRLTVRIEVLS